MFTIVFPQLILHIQVLHARIEAVVRELLVVNMSPLRTSLTTFVGRILVRVHDIFWADRIFLCNGHWPFFGAIKIVIIILIVSWSQSYLDLDRYEIVNGYFADRADRAQEQGPISFYGFFPQWGSPTASILSYKFPQKHLLQRALDFGLSSLLYNTKSAK